MSPEDEKFVLSALASLPRLRMPAEVSNKLMAAISAESATRQLALRATRSDRVAGVAPVIELAPARRRRTWIGAAVAAAAASAAAVVAVGALATQSAVPADSPGSDSVIQNAALVIPMTASDVDYRHETLNTQITEQFAARVPVPQHVAPARSVSPSASPSTSATASDAVSVPTKAALAPEVLAATFLESSERVSSCLRGLDRAVAHILRIDVATFHAVPVAVIAFRGHADKPTARPDQVEVFVVKRDCSATDPGALGHTLLTAP